MSAEGQLNNKHFDIVDEYLQDVSLRKTTSYMLTIARDGESPVRSIIFYDNAIEASEAYNMYKDWGFAKQYLTVTLYEPSGRVNQKVFKRNQAGDPTFLRQNYYDVSDALKMIKANVDDKLFEEVCKKIAISFSKDNWRFDPDRFLKNLGIDKKVEDWM